MGTTKLGGHKKLGGSAPERPKATCLPVRSSGRKVTKLFSL